MFDWRSLLVALLAWLGLAGQYDIDADQLASDTAGAVAYAVLLPPPAPPTPLPPAGASQVPPPAAPKVKPVPMTQPMRVPYYSPRWRRR